MDFYYFCFKNPRNRCRKEKHRLQYLTRCHNNVLKNNNIPRRIYQKLSINNVRVVFLSPSLSPFISTCAHKHLSFSTFSHGAPLRIMFSFFSLNPHTFPTLFPSRQKEKNAYRIKICHSSCYPTFFRRLFKKKRKYRYMLRFLFPHTNKKKSNNRIELFVC